jgi:sugar lactone lactonase YvrE
VGIGGDTLRTVMVERDPVPVPGAVRDSMREMMEERVAEARAQGMRTSDDVVIPGEHPAYESLATDASGRLWVSTTAPDGTGRHWHIFTEEGVLQGSIPLPEGVPGFMTPAVRDGRMAVATQLQGIPQVMVYRIVGLGRR